MRRRKKYDSPYVDNKRRHSRKRNQKDQYGIYAMPEHKVKTKKKKVITLQTCFHALVGLFLVLVLMYGISLGVKFSMYKKGCDRYDNSNYEDAIPLFEESLRPRLPLLEFFDNNVRFYLADCYVNMGEYDEACYEYNQIRLWTDEEKDGLDYLSNVAYGLQLYAWEDYRQALPILSKAYEDGYRDLVLYVGNCYGQMGDMENMQIYYDIFLRDNPMNSFMYAQYAAIELDEGNLEGAFEYIEMGKKLKDQSSAKELLFDEIVYYEKMKDYNTAYEKAKEFMEEYPNDLDGKKEYDLLYTRKSEQES